MLAMAIAVLWIYELGEHLLHEDHFNREYKSLFGLPPMRDVERLREAAESVVRN